MFKKILGTIFSKGLVTIVSFITLLLTTHILGAQGRGDAIVITTAVGLMGLVNDFIGGSSLVYLIPKQKNSWYFTHVLLFSLVGAVIVSILGTIVFKFGFFMVSGYWKYVFIIGLLTCIYSSILILILGYEDIRNYNLVGVFQPILTLCFFAGASLLGYGRVSTYIYSLGLSYLITIVMMIIMLRKIQKKLKRKSVKLGSLIILTEMISLGSVAQLGNLIQYLNYRFSYFVIDAHIGASGVGIYSVAVKISESIWLIAQSISLVQYTTITNSHDDKYSINLTIKLVKLSFVITTFLIILLIIIPGSLFGLIFGKDFSPIRIVLIYLSPGVIALGVGLILSHYFSGKGNYLVNTIGAFIGLCVSIPGCFLLIPGHGYLGAAATASIAYLVTVFYQMAVFINTTKVKIIDFKFNNNDWQQVSMILNKIKKQKRESSLL